MGANRGDGEGLTAWSQHRATCGQVVGARARAGGNDQAVARNWIQILVVDVQLQDGHLLAVTGHDERVEDDVLDRPERAERLVAAFELDTNGRINAHVEASGEHLVQARLPARRWHVRQKAESAEVDPQDRHLAIGPRCAHHRAVTADDDLHGSLRRIVGVCLAFFEPRAHLFGERDGLRFAWIDDHAQAPRLAINPSPVARLLHRSELCQARSHGCSTGRARA